MNIITVLYYFLKFALRDRKLKVISDSDQAAGKFAPVLLHWYLCTVT